MTNIADLRQDYTKASLDLDTIAASPFTQFRKWFDEAIKSEVLEPNAFVLSTVAEGGKPFQRTVLMKALDDKGVVFYTNYKSRKAQQIEENPNVSILFPWYALERQVAITGRIEKVTKMESLAYFTSRPHGSQLGAWVSHQSQVIKSRSILEMKLQEMKAKFMEGKVPLPDFWGGYRIVPETFEFWQGRQSRLHDRIMYQKLENEDWSTFRMAP
ncbi:pyridoxamine 5'-phosphate oxidase [Roseivirga echinicomitans]|uniref:Pyridoxine/pyridoxamine 5'-phosphate oxidase n=1 Tax=Roseivirga echinicomitans TaxID=296218 RepID=A0A150XSY0_9BACT|nr:pyridoxamine 5'-phosphate oxidase [Roseivirga echinicomitans]KYG81804.1 pyridoxine 5'-phosphate oxidase [Roseivirga echinicomitans]